MKMENMVRIPPVPFSDLEGMAGWLESMALEGLYYDGLYYHRYFVTSILFKKGPPAQVRYRIDPSKGNLYHTPPPGLVALYEECGWKYVDSPGRFTHIFMTEDQDAPEPYYQPEILGQALNPMIKSRKYRLFLAGSVFLAELLLFCHMLYSGLLQHRSVWLHVAMFLLFAAAFVLTLLRTFRLSVWKEQLQKGQETKPYLPAKNTIRNLLLLLMSLLVVLVHAWLDFVT